MKEDLLIFGTGSIAPEVIDFIERYDLYNIIGFTIDEKNIENNQYHGLPVFPAEKIEQFVDPSKVKAFIAVSWYNHMNRVKREKYNYLKEKGFSFANLISPTSTILANDIGEGNWINDFAYLSYDTHVGDNNVFRTYSLLGHHSAIGNHCVVGGKSVISGHVTVGDQTYIGVAAVLFNKLTIGNQCLIGGGAVVKKNLSDFSICTAPEAGVVVTNKQIVENALTPKFAKLFAKRK